MTFQNFSTNCFDILVVPIFQYFFPLFPVLPVIFIIFKVNTGIITKKKINNIAIIILDWLISIVLP